MGRQGTLQKLNLRKEREEYLNDFIEMSRNIAYKII